MTDVMLDLETMGNGSNAPIIAIGAVAFDRSGILAKFYTQVSLESAIAHGGVMDPSTVLWWLQQSDDVRAAFKGNEKAPTLPIALQAFASWYTAHNGAGLWGNGATFDNVILANAYRAAYVPPPWKFWNDRCYRTIKSIYRDVQMPRTGTHHNAVDDAESQALHLIQIVQKHNIPL